MWKDIIINKSEASTGEASIEFYSVVINLYEVFNNCGRRHRLYSCNAEIWEYKGFLALVSYGTPIALYTPDNATLYDCLRIVYGYTATSAKHICKFSKWLAENNHPVQEFVRFRD